MAAKAEEKSANTETSNNTGPVVPQVQVTFEPEKTLFTWKAAARPFKKREREYWITLLAIAAVFGLILFIVEGLMPVMLIIALFFLYYILSTVEPEDIEYKITNQGIRVAENLTDWTFMVRFWFTKRFSDDVLVVETTNVPGRLELVVNARDIEKMTNAISSYIPYEKAPPSNLDKAINWFSSKLPGNQ